MKYQYVGNSFSFIAETEEDREFLSKLGKDSSRMLRITGAAQEIGEKNDIFHLCLGPANVDNFTEK